MRLPVRVYYLTDLHGFPFSKPEFLLIWRKWILLLHPKLAYSESFTQARNIDRVIIICQVLLRALYLSSGGDLAENKTIPVQGSEWYKGCVCSKELAMERVGRGLPRGALFWVGQLGISQIKKRWTKYLWQRDHRVQSNRGLKQQGNLPEKL